MNPLYQNSQNDNIITRFNRFRQTISGDPQQQVQQLLNSGKVSQDQYNRAVQVANQLRKMMGI